MNKFLSIAAIMTMAMIVALAPAASTIYAEAYPLDGVKRAALDTCAADPGFDRLQAGERARCYARLLQVPAMDSPLPPRRLDIADTGPAAIL